MKIQDKDVPSLFQRKVCWAALTGLALLVVVALVCGLLFGVGSLFVALCGRSRRAARVACPGV